MERRDRLTSEVGPDGSGSKPGMEPWTPMPEKAGMDGAPSLPLAGATVGAAACPKAGVAAAATSITVKRKSRRCKVMLSSLFMGFRRSSRIKLHPVRLRLEGEHNVAEPITSMRGAASPTQSGVIRTNRQGGSIASGLLRRA